jgi:phage shock protein PspC (stress-responsive transcriptional regulator)
MVEVQARERNRQQVNAVRGGILWPRVGAASGLAFILLQLAALGFMSSGGWLDPGASKADIVKAFAATPPCQLWIGAYLSVLAGLSFIPFTARVITVLRRAEGAPGWLSTTALAGGILLVASELGGAGAVNALLTRAGHDLSAAEAMTLFDLAQALLFLFWAGGTLFLTATAVASLKLHALPRWLGGVAAGIAAVSLIAPASTQLLHIPATLFYLWVIAASIVLLRVPREPQEEGPDRSPVASLA